MPMKLQNVMLACCLAPSDADTQAEFFQRFLHGPSERVFYSFREAKAIQIADLDELVLVKY